jgi:peptide-methionine (R)-S-oxide reductase
MSTFSSRRDILFGIAAAAGTTFLAACGRDRSSGPSASGSVAPEEPIAANANPNGTGMTTTTSAPASGSGAAGNGTYVAPVEDVWKGDKVQLSDAEWRAKLTPEQYHILRQEGTERAFSGNLVDQHGKGKFRCAACGLLLFTSDTKFESGTGWPSFYKPATKTSIDEHSDTTFGMTRTEVKCPRCGGHLGHVFDDGPAPTGLRYCINSPALRFEPDPS